MFFRPRKPLPVFGFIPCEDNKVLFYMAPDDPVMLKAVMNEMDTTRLRNIFRESGWQA